MSDIASMLSQYTDVDGNVSMNPEDLLKVMATLSSGAGAPAEKKTKTRKAKDPNAPKRPKNAYMMWLDENRSRIKEELGTSKVSEVAKAAGVEWKALDSEVRGPYEERAAEAKAAYQELKGTYVAPKVVKAKYNIDEYPDAPEGWSGPFEMKYLSGYAKGPNGKTMRFASFEDAVEAANSVEGCGGITKEYRCYTLRVGTDLITQVDKTPKCKGLASWVKGDLVVPKVMTTGLPGMISGTDMTPVSTPSVEIEVPAPAPAPAPEPEPEPEGDDDDEEEMEVTEFEFEGKEYVYDEDFNVYDPEGEGDVLGKYVDGRVEFN